MLSITKKFLFFFLVAINTAAYAQFVKNYVLELNPLILANQGVGLNNEVLLTEQISLGTNLEYYAQMPYDNNNVKATRNMLNLAPFARYYVFSAKLEGLFVGIKLNLTSSQATIEDGTESSSYNKFFVAPTAHFGYRFVAHNGFTVSAYAGGGLKSSNNKFPASGIPLSRINNQDWLNAQHKLNENVSSAQPDYGFTLGYIF